MEAEERLQGTIGSKPRGPRWVWSQAERMHHVFFPLVISSPMLLGYSGTSDKGHSVLKDIIHENLYIKDKFSCPKH